MNYRQSIYIYNAIHNRDINEISFIQHKNYEYFILGAAFSKNKRSFTFMELIFNKFQFRKHTLNYFLKTSLLGEKDISISYFLLENGADLNEITIGTYQNIEIKNFANAYKKKDIKKLMKYKMIYLFDIMEEKYIKVIQTYKEILNEYTIRQMFSVDDVATIVCQFSFNKLYFI